MRELEGQLLEIQKERADRRKRFWKTESGILTLDKKIRDIQAEIYEKRQQSAVGKSHYSPTLTPGRTIYARGRMRNWR